VALAAYARSIADGVHDNLDYYIDNSLINSKVEDNKVASQFGYYKYRIIYDTVTRTNARIKKIEFSKQLFETFAGFSYYAGRTDHRGNSRLGKVVHAPVSSRIGYIAGAMPIKARHVLGNP